jgi:hypothetical protein
MSDATLTDMPRATPAVAEPNLDQKPHVSVDNGSFAYGILPCDFFDTMPDRFLAIVSNRAARHVRRTYGEPRMKSRIVELGSEPLPGSSAKFARLFATDSVKWAKVIRAAGIKAG